MQNESKFIQNLQSLFQYEGIPEGMKIGDDCSVLPWTSTKNLLVTKDLLVEDIHFKKDTTTAYELGVKTAEVNLSDIAAMGGRPLYAFLGIAIPADTQSNFVQNFLQGLRFSLNSRKVLLLGGDTTASPMKMVFSLTVMGEVEKKIVKFRNGACPGDVVVVTGNLGDSGAGLLLLKEKLEQNETNLEAKKYLRQRHNQPQAHLEKGEWLAQCLDVHAMMDVSDGIASDAMKMAIASSCSMEIYLNTLPLSKELINVGTEKGWEVNNLALCGGEDYCLLLTMTENAFKIKSKEYFDKFGEPLYLIGSVSGKKENNPNDIIQYYTHLKGTRISIEIKGYEHFAGESDTK